MTLMSKKNAETESGLRNEMEKVKKEVEEGKTKFNGAMKRKVDFSRHGSYIRTKITSMRRLTTTLMDRGHSQ